MNQVDHSAVEKTMMMMMGQQRTMTRMMLPMMTWRTVPTMVRNVTMMRMMMMMPKAREPLQARLYLPSPVYSVYER